MKFVTIDDRRYVQFDRLADEPGLTHAYCTRPQDISLHDGPHADDARRNRAQFAADWGFDAERLVLAVQIHRTDIAVIDRPTTGPVPDVDGLITSFVDTPLLTFSADCPLLLAYDRRQRVLGVAHASWRCTVGRITTKLVELMRDRFGCAPRDLRVGVGPGAGPCCYEVGPEVLEAATLALPDSRQHFQTRDGRLYFDLWRANRALLLDAGVPEDNIETAELCTLCRNDLFYSYRKEGACGRFGLLAGLRDA